MQYLHNWLEEKGSAYLYLIVAKQEKDPTKKQLFRDLASGAEKQASMWAKEMKKASLPLPSSYRPDFRTRLVGFLLRYFSIQQLRFILSAMKVRGMSIYGDHQLKHHHHQFVSGGAKLENRHKGLSTAGNLRAAVFGVNDGLVSNMSLLLGLVGGAANSHVIILSGVAGLLAGACSMAAGEYVSMRSQREFFEFQIALEREELDLYPEEEASELAAIYQARGLPKKEAQELAKHMISNPEKALDTLAKEELGLNPQDLGSPIGAAISSFISFSLGAFIPLFPFLLSANQWNVPLSILLTGITLFFIGATLSLFTNLSAFKGGLRMLSIGASAGCLTYLIGRLVGISLS